VSNYNQKRTDTGIPRKSSAAESMQKLKTTGIILGILFLLMIYGLSTCGSGDYDSSSETDPKKSSVHLDYLVDKHKLGNEYSIVLDDMDFTEPDTYKHKYLLYSSRSTPDTVIVDSTKWINVNAIFFDEHIEDLGMEIWSSSDGKVSKVSSPAGYSNYYGNTRYGYWNPATQLWMFHAQYMYLSNRMYYSGYPIHRNSWNNYSTNYRNKTPFYGQNSSGKTEYGSKGAAASRVKPNSHWYKKSSAQRSTIGRGAASKSKNIKSSFNSKRAKTGRTRSSFRSRGGGFGK
jgi:hypothetical protein